MYISSNLPTVSESVQKVEELQEYKRLEPESESLVKRDLMADFNKVDHVPDLQKNDSKEKVSYMEGIFGGPNVRVETYSLVNNLNTQPTENPKIREALDQIENHEGS